MKRFIPLLVLCGGFGAAFFIAAARYRGTALHAILLCLGATAAAALCGALAARRLRLGRGANILVVLGCAACAASAAAAHEIGIDGILPRADGGQNTGLGAIAANPDLFLLAALTPLLAFLRRDS